MSKVFETMVDEVQAELQDDGTVYSDTFVAIQLEDALREISDYSSHEMMEVFKIESRTGTADEDKSSALVDDTLTQFVDVVDIGKDVYNMDDKTWAAVTAYVDTGELTLSSDIFPDGNEDYAIFNKGCRNKFQINIEDVTDYAGDNHGVFAVEYPLGARRNFKVEGNILTVDVDLVDDSAGSDASVEVYVWFNKVHRATQLTDPVGTVNGAVAAGLKALTVAAIGTGTEEIAETMLFTVAGVRGTYRVTADMSLSSGGGAIAFWPPLENAITDGAVITFQKSTLNTILERLVVELTAARCGFSMFPNKISIGGRGVFSRFETKLAIVLAKLERLGTPRTKRRYPTSR